MIREKVITDEDLTTLWEAGQNDTGKVKGPVTMIARLFKTLGRRSDDGKIWETKGEMGRSTRRRRHYSRHTTGYGKRLETPQ